MEHIEAEDSVGLRLLEFFLTFTIQDMRRNLGIREKRALRQTCKTLKAVSDATITSAFITKTKTILSAASKDDWIQFKIETDEPGTLYFWGVMDPNQRTQCFQRLDHVCNRFPLLERIKIKWPDWNRYTNNNLINGIIKPLPNLCLLEVNKDICGAMLPDYFSAFNQLTNLTLQAAIDGIDPLQHLKELRHLTLQLDLPPTTARERKKRLQGEAKVPKFKVPDLLFTSFPYLRVLKLTVHGDGACSLPKTTGNLECLQELDLRVSVYTNEICRCEALPDSFGELSALSRLRLTACQGLDRLPETFTDLTSLVELSLVKCEQLKRLPDFSNMKKVCRLLIDNCHALSSLPSSVQGLDSLERLELHECSALTKLPESIGELKSLKELSIIRCRRLKAVPKFETMLTTLESLKLEGCLALVEPDIEALKEKFGDVLDYSSACHAKAKGKQSELTPAFSMR